MKTRVMIILAGLCAVPVAAARADGPATRPSDNGNRPTTSYPMKGDRRLGPFGGSGFGGALRPDKAFAPTEAEMQAAEQFLKEELPMRYELFAQIPQGAPMRQRVLALMAVKYRGLIRVKDQDPEMYEQLLKEAKLEDEAMRFALDAHKGDTSADAKLHDKARELVDLSLENRQARIERLEEQLRHQKDQLARDMEHREEKADEKANMLTKDFNRLFDVMDRRRGKDGSSTPTSSPPTTAAPSGEKKSNPQ